MGKTRKQTQAEITRKAYFAYWKLQNNPEYLKAYREGLSPSDRKKFNLPFLIFKPSNPDPVLLPFVDPSKKIDWANMLTNPDPEIVNLHPGFTPAKQTAGWKLMKEIIEKEGAVNLNKWEGPVVTFEVDLRFDNKEIFHTISRIITNLRRARKIKPSRDSISKFDLYAQVWDLRRGPYKKTYPQIGRDLKLPISTVKSRFRRAFEAIYGIQYAPGILDRSKVQKEDLRRICRTCHERETCKEPCPDVIPYIIQDHVTRREKLTGESGFSSQKI